MLVQDRLSHTGQNNPMDAEQCVPGGQNLHQSHCKQNSLPGCLDTLLQEGEVPLGPGNLKHRAHGTHIGGCRRAQHFTWMVLK